MPRFAIFPSTSDDQLRRLLQQIWWEIRGREARYLALSSAKRVLGQHRYERLRGRVLHNVLRGQ